MTQLGNLLFLRAGKGFKIDVGTPESLDIKPCIAEAVLMAKRTGLAALLLLPLMKTMVVEANSDTARLEEGWAAAIRREREPYLGTKYDSAVSANERKRSQALNRLPGLTTHNPTGWANRKESVRGTAKIELELAELWARFIQSKMNQRAELVNTIHASLYLADPDGYFGPQTRAAVLKPLQEFWPFYDATIRKELRDFKKSL